MLAHAVAVSADVDDVAVVDEAVDERAGHDVIAQDLAPVIKALVAGEHRARRLVASAHELEKEHGPRPTDGQIADLVDDQETGEDQRLQAMPKVAGLLGFLE